MWQVGYSPDRNPRSYYHEIRFRRRCPLCSCCGRCLLSRTSDSVAAPPKVAFHAFATMGLTTSMLALAATVRLWACDVIRAVLTVCAHFQPFWSWHSTVKFLWLWNTTQSEWLNSELLTSKWHLNLFQICSLTEVGKWSNI